MASSKDAGPKPRNDAYTGLLAISFLALVGATVLMAMDAKELGTPPPGKLDIGVPGSTAGKAGEGLKRPDVKADPGAAPPKDAGMGARAEPKPLPELPPIVPVKAEVPAKAEGDLPPLPIPTFEPPM